MVLTQYQVNDCSSRPMVELEADSSDEDVQARRSPSVLSRSTAHQSQPMLSSRGPTPAVSACTETEASSSRATSRQATPARPPGGVGSRQSTPQPSIFASSKPEPPSLDTLSIQSKNRRITRSASRSSLNVHVCSDEPQHAGKTPDPVNSYRATPVVSCHVSWDV